MQPLLLLFAAAAAGLLVGCGLGLAVFKTGARRRHLLWSAPLAAMAASAGLAIAIEGGIDAAFRVPALWWTSGALLLAMITGWLGAVASFPLRAMYEVAWGGSKDDSERVRQLVETPAARTPWPSFVEGFTAAFDGFRYLCYRPQLWRYGVLPIVINMFLVLGVLLTLLAGGWLLADWFDSLFPDGTGWLILEIMAVVLIIAAACGLALITWKVLEGVLCGHFYGKLARHVELDLGTEPDELREISLSYQLYDTARDVFSLIGINVGFLALHIIPVIGSIAGFCGAAYFDCLLFGRDYFDFPLALRGKRRSEKLAFIRGHRAHTLGLGTSVLLFNFVPIVGSVVLTTAAVGAVLLYHRIGVDAAKPRAGVAQS